MSALWTDPRIKTLFSNKALENLDAMAVYSMGFNTRWRGDIVNKGSTVRVFSFPRPTINDYTVPSSALASQLISYQRLGPTYQELTIDQDKDWAIAEDQIQAMMADPDLFDELAKNGAWAFHDVIDRHLATVIHGGAGSVDGITGSGVGSAPIVGNGATDDITAYVLIERIRESFKDRSVPGVDLHIFVPNWLMTMIRVDPRFTGFGTTQNRQTANGEDIVKLAGITIHETINALDGAGTAFDTNGDANAQNRVLATWEGAATWAMMRDPQSMVHTIKAEDNILSRDNVMRAFALWGAKIFIADGALSQIVQKGEYEPS